MLRKLFLVFSIYFSFSSTVFAEKLVDVASGKNHALLLFADGHILPFGENYYGQLGLPKTKIRQVIYEKSPLYIDTSIKFISVAVGLDHSLAISEDGSLWGWGNNDYSQLGLNTPKNIEKPQLLTDSKDWEKVFAGGNESLALKKDGSLWNIRKFETIKNPDNNAWVDVQIFGEYWGFSDYTLIVVLKDSKGKFWTYGSCNKTSDDFDILNSFIKEKNDDFWKILPVELPLGIKNFQVTDLAGAYERQNDILIFGLSASNEKNIMQIREKIDKNKKLYSYLSSIRQKEEAKDCKQFFTGNFKDITTFISEYNTKNGVSTYYSYTALLQNYGQVVLWTNGKRFVSDKKLKIKSIFGGYNIFVQTDDDKIYGIGYFYPQNDYTTQELFSYYIPINY